MGANPRGMAAAPPASISVSITDTALHAVLALAVPELHRHCVDPWVLIGSAAARLAGAEVTVADVDVLVSVRDADALIDHWRARQDESHAPADSDRFRSRFARFDFPGLPLELMGGLELRGDSGWAPVRIDDIVMLDVAGVAVPVPAVSEQIRVLESFGRPKDLRRAASLRLLPGARA